MNTMTQAAPAASTAFEAFCSRALLNVGNVAEEVMAKVKDPVGAGIVLLGCAIIGSVVGVAALAYASPDYFARARNACGETLIDVGHRLLTTDDDETPVTVVHRPPEAYVPGFDEHQS